jgi:hypothetical protein
MEDPASRPSHPRCRLSTSVSLAEVHAHAAIRASIRVRHGCSGEIMNDVTRRWLVVGGGCLVLAVVAALLVLRQHQSDQTSHTTSAPIVFAAGETFSPKEAPSGQTYLTADEAWARWEDGQHLTAEVTAQFGVRDYQQDRQSVWAYSQRGCAVPLGDPSAQDVALAKSPKCRLWTFLNAKTGTQIDTTDQLPSSP